MNNGYMQRVHKKVVEVTETPFSGSAGRIARESKETQRPAGPLAFRDNPDVRGRKQS